MPSSIASTDYVKNFVKGVEAETVSRVNSLDTQKQSKTLSSSITIDGTPQTTVEGVLSAMSNASFSSSDSSSETLLRIGTTKCKPNIDAFKPYEFRGPIDDVIGQYIWTDGDNIYYSYGSTQCVLNKSTSTWENKVWSGLTNFYGQYIWTDGTNIYYSNGTTRYVLNKSTSTWENKVWNGYASFSGASIWTDGDNIYYSQSSKQYVLNKSTSTWSTKSWSGLTSFIGQYIWTDGDNIYYSQSGNNYVLNKSTSTWSTKSWNGLTSFYGNSIWTDGDNIYYSYNGNNYVLNKSTSTLEVKKWSGYTGVDGRYIWTDGTNIYYSNGSGNYILDRTSTYPILSGAQSTSGYAYSNHTHGIFTTSESGFAPASTNANYYLRGDGTWQSVDTITSTEHRTKVTVDEDYYHRNIAYGSSSTPTSDSTYGGSGAMYIYY